MSDAFVPRSSHPSAESLFAGAALLDAEKLDCYRIALEFQAIAGQLVPKRGYTELRDQLDRASISIVLNIAEGCGRRSAADKATSTRWRVAARPSARPSSTCSVRAASSTIGCATARAPCSSASCRCSVGWSRG